MHRFGTSPSPRFPTIESSQQCAPEPHTKQDHHSRWHAYQATPLIGPRPGLFRSRSASVAKVMAERHRAVSRLHDAVTLRALGGEPWTVLAGAGLPGDPRDDRATNGGMMLHGELPHGEERETCGAVIWGKMLRVSSI
ncbi:hypothetical protein VTJ04DRAFT_4325 [Mycothermus thermophilus]|uniref:uncharacterized protein n=1 Tax=Humicola insolens TaxID=85995 RepID=UPI0037443765